jgi:hypothetical protein
MRFITMERGKCWDNRSNASYERVYAACELVMII